MSARPLADREDRRLDQRRQQRLHARGAVRQDRLQASGRSSPTVSPASCASSRIAASRSCGGQNVLRCDQARADPIEPDRAIGIDQRFDHIVGVERVGDRRAQARAPAPSGGARSPIGWRAPRSCASLSHVGLAAAPHLRWTPASPVRARRSICRARGLARRNRGSARSALRRWRRRFPPSARRSADCVPARRARRAARISFRMSALADRLVEPRIDARELRRSRSSCGVGALAACRSAL